MAAYVIPPLLFLSVIGRVLVAVVHRLERFVGELLV